MSKGRYERKKSAVVTVGWLFADLLLALGMLFLVSSPPRPKLPPTLVVNPSILDPTNSHCTGGIDKPQCMVTIGETTSSQGNMVWAVTSDMSNSVIFQPARGLLAPGKSVTVMISAFPCQNGSFTFSGSRGTLPVAVAWRCTPLPNDRILEHTYCQVQLNIGSPIVFIHDTINQARGIVEPQLNAVRFLQDRQIGIAIAYGGTIGGTEEQGTEVASQVYNALQKLARDQQAHMYPVLRKASWYEPLFTGLQKSSTAILNVYLVVRPNNLKDTCNAQHNPI